jgi:hypothetical protein
MRTPDNQINTMVLFWYLVYALALFSVFVARILAHRREATPAKIQSEGIAGSDRGAALSVVNQLKS